MGHPQAMKDHNHKDAPNIRKDLKKEERDQNSNLRDFTTGHLLKDHMVREDHQGLLHMDSYQKVLKDHLQVITPSIHLRHHKIDLEDLLMMWFMQMIVCTDQLLLLLEAQ